MAGDKQQKAHRQKLILGKLLALFFNSDQRRDQIIARVNPPPLKLAFQVVGKLVDVRKHPERAYDRTDR